MRTRAQFNPRHRVFSTQVQKRTVILSYRFPQRSRNSSTALGIWLLSTDGSELKIDGVLANSEQEVLPLEFAASFGPHRHVITFSVVRFVTTSPRTIGNPSGSRWKQPYSYAKDFASFAR